VRAREAVTAQPTSQRRDSQAAERPR